MTDHTGDDTVQAMKTLINDFQTNRPNTKLTLSTVFPRIANKHKPLIVQTHTLLAHAQGTRKVNDFLLDTEHGHENVDVIHHAEIHQDPDILLARDGLHPNFAGVAVISRNIKYRIRNEFKETQPRTRSNETSHTEQDAKLSTNIRNNTRSTKVKSQDASTQTVDVKPTPPTKHIEQAEVTEARTIFTQTSTCVSKHTDTQTDIVADLSTKTRSSKQRLPLNSSPRRSARNKHN